MREPDGEERYIFPGDVHGDTMSGEIGVLNKEGRFRGCGTREWRLRRGRGLCLLQSPRAWNDAWLVEEVSKYC